MSTRVVSDLLESKGSELFTVSPEATVQEALELMVAKNVSSLVVTAGDELVGIISERDYIRKAVPRRFVPWEISVRDLMTKDVIRVSPGDSIQQCMELMSSHRIRHLPVVEGKTVVGMLSISDLVRALRPARIEFPDPS